MKWLTIQKIPLLENINSNFETFKSNKIKLRNDISKLKKYFSFRKMNLKNENNQSSNNCWAYNQCMIKR